MDPLYRWARDRLARCEPTECGTVFPNGTDYRIDLSNANLQWAKLTDTSLYKSDFRNARLKYADLRRARLMGSNLRLADLRGADLRKAVLWSATLSNADLRGADLRGADVLRTTFGVPEHTVEGIPVAQEAAKLQGADLRKLKSWTPQQLQAAFWDETTVWPSDYTPPCARNLPESPCED